MNSSLTWNVFSDQGPRITYKVRIVERDKLIENNVKLLIRSSTGINGHPYAAMTAIPAPVTVTETGNSAISAKTYTNVASPILPVKIVRNNTPRSIPQI